jgi:hypothetical protein
VNFTRVAVSLALAGVLVGCGGSARRSTGATATSVARRVGSATAINRPTRTTEATRRASARPQPNANRIDRRSRRAAIPFRFRARTLWPAVAAQISKTSWHRGCPVALRGLRYVRISYWGFDRRPHLGEMVVNAMVVGDVRRAFETLFAARFPIRRMRLVDRYGGSDYASIQGDNTSAFNCRDATGSSRWSEHAYGKAIDINPIENPYVYADGTTTHRASHRYLDRADVRPGMAVPGGALVRAFAAIGWGWGGRWQGPTDFQHFSVTGR